MKLIAAISLNNVIGKNNTLPWAKPWPEDLKRFRKLTTNTSIIMGRKTFESIGRALPNRQNIVISSKHQQDNDVIYASSLEDAFSKAEKEICIIGGASVYKQAMQLAKQDDTIDLTIIPESISGDNIVSFPDIDQTWILENKEVCDDGRVILQYTKAYVL